MAKSGKSQFERTVKNETGESLIREFLSFLRSNKKWWLLPILLMFMIFGLLLVLSGTGLAPYIYSLF